MSASYAIIISLGACILAAALEGACAGKGVKAYYEELRFPPYSAPLWFWYIIGGLYYGVFFFVIYRLLRHDSGGALHRATLMLIFFMMAANAFWNYVFFRARNLFLGFIGGSIAPIFDVVLFICLIELDELAAWSLVPYLLYRIYAVWWGYGVWKLNRRVA